MMILATDRPADEATVARIRAIAGITSVRVIEL
jgi:hypothetical protein